MPDHKIVKVKNVSEETREEILKDYKQSDQTVIMSVPSASNGEDLTRFATMNKYFKGIHHFAELMYPEKYHR